MNDVAIGPVAQMMKDGCWDLHQSAENGAVAKKMISGELSKGSYVELAKQMYLFNRALDQAIMRHRATTPALQNLIADEQLQAPYYEQDLAYFGEPLEGLVPSPGVAEAIALIERIETEQPRNLLALHYVREGANNGNRFVAKKLMQVWDTGPEGFSHLDPYGEAQRAKWEAFKAALNEQPFTAEQKLSLVATGRSMFEAVMAIHRDIEVVSPVG
ncbi:MAG: biliverdin-producing heme oxygenase [Planctomycetota bacterium]